MSAADLKRTWKRWRQLVNMTQAELAGFLQSEDGRSAGLSAAEAKRQGIKSGHESARWILKMLPDGTSFGRACENWTPAMWTWAKRQVSFISRMRGNKGSLWKPDGTPSRKQLALLLWGHDPLKKLRAVR